MYILGGILIGFIINDVLGNVINFICDKTYAKDYKERLEMELQEFYETQL